MLTSKQRQASWQPDHDRRNQEVWRSGGGGVKLNKLALTAGSVLASILPQQKTGATDHVGCSQASNQTGKLENRNKEKKQKK